MTLTIKNALTRNKPEKTERSNRFMDKVEDIVDRKTTNQYGKQSQLVYNPDVKREPVVNRIQGQGINNIMEGPINMALKILEKRKPVKKIKLKLN